MDASITHLLRTCLSKSAKDQSVNPTPLALLKDTTKLKKHITLLCDRLGRGAHLVTDSHAGGALVWGWGIETHHAAVGPDGARCSSRHGQSRRWGVSVGMGYRNTSRCCATGWNAALTSSRTVTQVGCEGVGWGKETHDAAVRPAGARCSLVSSRTVTQVG